MTLAELKTVLTSITGYSNKVAYYAFPEGAAPALPFICYDEKYSNNLVADGKVYHEITGVDVELYCDKKDQTEEAKVEAALTSAGIVWTKNCEYIESEKCWMTIYAIEV